MHTNVIYAGRWAIDGVNLYLFEEDADGLALPSGDSVTLDDESMVTITSGEYTLTTTLLSFEAARNPLSQMPLTDTRHLTLAMAPNIPLPEFTISLPIAGQPTIITSTKQVWCTRLDFRGRDQINITNFGANFTLADTRIIVRNDGSWDTMDTFTLDGDTTTSAVSPRLAGAGGTLNCWRAATRSHDAQRLSSWLWWECG